MSVIIFFILLTTIAQIFFNGFSLWWLVALIIRALFACRSIGVTFKVKKLAIAEGVVLACMMLFNLFFKGDNPYPWVPTLIAIIAAIICIALEYLDDMLYVYVIEDDDDEI